MPLGFLLLVRPTSAPVVVAVSVVAAMLESALSSSRSSVSTRASEVEVAEEVITRILAELPNPPASSILEISFKISSHKLGLSWRLGSQNRESVCQNRASICHSGRRQSLASCPPTCIPRMPHSRPTAELSRMFWNGAGALPVLGGSGTTKSWSGGAAGATMAMARHLIMSLRLVAGSELVASS